MRSLVRALVLLALHAPLGDAAMAALDRAPPAVRNLQPPIAWLDDHRLWVRTETADGGTRHELVDAESGARRPLFDHRWLAAALAESLGRDVDPAHLPVLDVRTVDGGAGALRPIRLCIAGDDHAWAVDSGTGQAVRAEPLADVGFGLEPLRRARPSRRNGPSTELRFVNRTDATLRLAWIDAQGEARDYGTIDPGATRAQHTFGGHVWRLEDEGGRVRAVFEAADQPRVAVIDDREPVAERPRDADRAGPAARRRDPSRSPDDRWRVDLVDHQVRLVPVAGGDPVTIADDGTPDDPYVGPVHWSPDGAHVVVMRRRDGEERRVHYVESSPRDQVQPKLHAYDYRKPGDRIPQARPRLFAVTDAGATAVPIDESLFPNPWSIDRVHWRPDSSGFSFLYNERGHQTMRVIAVDAATGAARAIVDERPATFFDYSQKTFLHHLDGTRELLWMSERDGWNHLFLIDADTGAVKRCVTPGDWVVRSVESVDEAGRTVLVRAMGLHPDQDPYHVHFVRASLDTGDLVVLTDGDGTHALELSPDGRFAIDRWSRVDQAPVVELRRMSDGARMGELVRADWSALAADGWRPPERFVATGRDGTTDIWGIIHRPRDFDPARRYPIVEQIYAGPHDHHVPKSFAVRHGAQELADLGFIVVQIDGMGTNWRSKAFHDVCWRNLGDAGFPDRIAWIRAAAATRPEMDLSRVGIVGGSAGGQNAMRALIAHHDFYTVAVADCGCHDNRMDKIWWNEAWMGWPVGPWYEDASNVVHAGAMEGHLLLIVGEMDENVDPASTMQVVDALVRADKDFDLLVIPGAGHGAAGTPYGRRRTHDFLRRWLQDAD